MGKELSQHVYCSECRALLRLPASGQMVRCPRCGKTFLRERIYRYGLEVGDRVAAGRDLSRVGSRQPTERRPESSGSPAAIKHGVDNSAWLEPAKWTLRDLEDLLRTTRLRTFGWPSAAEEPDPTSSESWLDGVIARAEHLRSELRFAPEWPVTYSDDQYSIVLLSQRDRWVRVWIQNLHRREACVAAFDPVNWDTAVRDRRVGTETVGLGIALFTDLALGLHRRGARGQSDAQYTMNVSASGLALSPADPFPFVGTGSDVLPATHRVRGFIRRLPDGHEPHEDQISLAPSYVRKRMGPQDTYVRPHVRGSSTQVEILAALRHTTNLRAARAGLRSDGDHS